MGEIIQNEGGGKKKGKRRAKKHSTHIDMTPMVDLACLLVTFFMLTTAFSKPKVMELVLPDKKDKTDPPKVDDSRTVNIILDNDKVYYYNGMAKPNALPEMVETNFSKDGLRKMLLHRNKDLFSKIKQLNEDVLSGKLVIPRDSVEARIKRFKKEDKLSPVVLIKATEKVKYGHIVDVVDEMAIADINRYAIVDMSPLEKKMLEAKNQQPK